MDLLEGIEDIVKALNGAVGTLDITRRLVALGKSRDLLRSTVILTILNLVSASTEEVSLEARATSTREESIPKVINTLAVETLNTS
jgi:hypothetical protein